MSRLSLSKNRLSKAICLAGLIALVLSLPGYAQVAPTGTISGVVTDASGSAIPNAQVKLTNTDTNVSQTATTGGQGGYRFSAIPIGHYDVTVAMGGFKSVTIKGVTLDVGQEAIENFKLAVGAVTEKVEVEADVTQVDTTSSSLGHLVDSKQIANLPLNGRNFIDLTMLQTGITQFSQNHFGSNGMFGTFFSSNGAPLRSNMYTLDGAIMGNIIGASASSISGLSLGLDGIQEYKTMTNTFSADYGLVMGSQTTIVTKGGSNRFHGDAFEYLRNNVLDARNYFDSLYALPTSTPDGGKRIAPFIRNQFGGAIGGPIKRDKVFFFGTYEGFRQLYDDLPTVALAATVPAACLAYSASANPNGDANLPTVGSACDSSLTGSQTETVAPAIQPILAQWPVPNIQPGNNVFFLSKSTLHEDYAQGRIDDTISSKDSIFGRYTYDNANEVYPNSYPQFTYGLIERQQYVTLAERHIFSPALLNSGSFSWSRSHVLDTTPSPGTAGAKLIGPQYSCITGAVMCPITVTGIGNLSSGTVSAIANVQDIFTVGDDAFWTKGKHEIKFGALFNHYDQYGDQGLGPKGAVSFTNLHNFLLGNYKSYTTYTAQGYNALKDMLSSTLGVYVQDDYHVARRLTLDLGLRYEFQTTPYEKNGNQSYFVNPPYSATYTLGPILGDPTYKDFSPRVGFAWDLFGNGSTSLRGGAALLYDITAHGQLFEMEGLAMPPYVNSYTITPATTGAPTTFTLPLPVPAAAAAVGAAPTTINHNYKSPRMYDFNLAIERKLPMDTILSVAYAGSRGLHLWSPQDEANPNCPTTNTVVPAGCGPVTSGTYAGFPGTTVASGNATWTYLGKTPKLNQNYSNFAEFNSDGVTWYNALEVNLTKKLSHGLQYTVAYTYSKNLDDMEGLENSDTSNGGSSLHTDPFNPLVDWGPSVFDVKSNLHASVLYNFPHYAGGNGVLGHMLNGWWTGNIISTQTGQAFAPLISADRQQTGLNGSKGGQERMSIVTPANLATLQAAALAAGVTTCSASCLAAGNLPYNPVVYNPKTVLTKTVNEWFNYNMFALQPVGTIGNVRKNTLRQPGLTEWDLSVNKDTALAKLGEGGMIQFRAEMFNIVNHPCLGAANDAIFTGAITDTAEYGVETNLTDQVNSGRQFQFSLKVAF